MTVQLATRWPLSGAGLFALGLFLSGCPIGAALDNPDDFTPPAGGAASMGGMGATGGMGGAGATGGGPGCDLEAAFRASCAFNICHGDDPVMPTIAPAAGLNLLSPTLAADITNMPASYAGVTDIASCPTPAELLINQTTPSESLMLKKLLGTQTCGDSMPSASVPITPADRDCIIAWANGLAAGGP
jgi:hypothetical protein